jgi:methionyl aminopeptidase
MSIKSVHELEKLQDIGSIVARTLQHVSARVRAGITTAELDDIGARFLRQEGARSAPPMVYGFPGALCISVNEEAIHGIPGSRVVCEGDVVKLDLVAEKDGFFADAAISVNVPPISEPNRSLVHCAERAFRRGLAMARAGNRILEIGRAVEGEVRRSGFSVLRELSGHGVGRTIHEKPEIPNYADWRARQRLTEGLVITIEPIIASGHGGAELQRDGWTIKTADRSISAHYEHTLVIARGEPVLLTAA